MREDWIKTSLEVMLDYIQPTKYIVESTNYDDSYRIPVLTAGKSFIKGYTNEDFNIFEDSPVIIFDDFTTASKFVNFDFKVKSSAMKILKPTSSFVNIKFVYYFMQTIRLNADTHKRYWISIYSKLAIPVPSFSEQRAIIAKIEQLFSELDNGISNLKKAQEQLKVYRQAVLKKAFEGELTRDWREKQTDLQSADELLKQIKIEREKYYLQQLADWEKSVVEWQAGGKVGKKPAKPRKAKEMPNLTDEELDSLSCLSPDWLKLRLEGITSCITDGDHQAPPKAEIGIPFITISNIKKNKIDFSKTYFVNEEYYDSLLEYRKPHFGDVLYTVTGSYGIPVLINFEHRFCFQRHIGLIRPMIFTCSTWLYWLLQTRFVFNQASVKATGTAQKTVGLASIRNFIIPFCSLDEQLQIVQEIETRLSVCDKVEADIKENLDKSEALRQSILKKAFEGSLLTEDELMACRRESDWEPAEELLKRIKV